MSNPTNNAFASASAENTPAQLTPHSLLEDKGLMIGGSILVLAIIILAISNFSGDGLKGSLTDDQGKDTTEISDSFKSGLSTPTHTPLVVAETEIKTTEQLDPLMLARIKRQQDTILALQAQLIKAQAITTGTTQTDTAAAQAEQNLKQQIALQQQALTQLQAQQKITSTAPKIAAQPVYVDALNAGETIEKIAPVVRQRSIPSGYAPGEPSIPVGVFPDRASTTGSSSSEVSRTVLLGSLPSDQASSISSGEVTR